MRDFLIIYVNGVRHEIRGGRAFQTLSNFLRYDLGLIGTKVVCAEGDCGSCTTLVGRPGAGNSVDYKPITSCIQFLYQLDGAHVVTVEGLKDDGKLNPVQDAMVTCQGAQCGFCTPGFVVAICSHLDRETQVDEQSMRAALIGNLCRCTGYESILKSGAEVDRPRFRGPNDLYPPGAMIEEMERLARDPVRIDAGDRTFFKPVRVAQAVEFRAEHPACVPIAGATDFGVQVNKRIRDPAIVMHLGAIANLREIIFDNDVITVGALATLTDCQRALEQRNLELARMFWRHGSPLIRNAGTLAGNIANASPIGDAIPALFVLDAEIELAGPRGARRVNANEFYTGYRKTACAADEIITFIHIPLPKADETLKLYQVTKRHDLDISTFTAAFWMQRSNGVIGEVRIAYGGCGPMVIRMKKTEGALVGKPFNEAEFESAGEIARSEITPISDVRGSANYRFLLAENMLKKFYCDAAGIETYERVTTPLSLAASHNGNGKAN